MSAFIGNTQPNNYYIGNTSLSALYVGANKIWPVGQEIAHFDFGNTLSYVGSGLTINNISANRNYIAGNTLTASVQLDLSLIDPSGSGRIMQYTASAAIPTWRANYTIPTSGRLLAMTGSTFTFETWVRPYPKKADGSATLSGPDSNPIFANQTSWFFGISNVNTNDASMVCIQNNGGGSLTTIQSASTAPNVVDFNQWNHLVYTFQRNSNNVTTFTMYKNGVQQTITKNNFTGNLSIGNPDWYYISPGHITTWEFGLYDMSQYRMYNKALDAAEVVSLFEATRARYSI